MFADASWQHGGIGGASLPLQNHLSVGDRVT